MKEIREKDDPILFKKSVVVDPKEIGSVKIQEIISDMKKALHSQDDGVAIAAPQIGVSLRIFIVAGKTLAMIAGDEKKPTEDMVCINPEIIKQSKKTEWMEEGCLSVRYLYGKVKRATKITIRAYNEKGVAFTRGGSGLLAQIFQHEIDHLDGILFVDKAEEIHEMLPHDIEVKLTKEGRNSKIGN